MFHISTSGFSAIPERPGVPEGAADAAATESPKIVEESAALARAEARLRRPWECKRCTLLNAEATCRDTCQVCNSWDAERAALRVALQHRRERLMALREDERRQRVEARQELLDDLEDVSSGDEVEETPVSAPKKPVMDVSRSTKSRQRLLTIPADVLEKCVAFLGNAREIWDLAWCCHALLRFCERDALWERFLHPRKAAARKDERPDAGIVEAVADDAAEPWTCRSCGLIQSSAQRDQNACTFCLTPRPLEAALSAPTVDVAQSPRSTTVSALPYLRVRDRAELARLWSERNKEDRGDKAPAMKRQKVEPESAPGNRAIDLVVGLEPTESRNAKREQRTLQAYGDMRARLRARHHDRRFDRTWGQYCLSAGWAWIRSLFRRAVRTSLEEQLPGALHAAANLRLRNDRLRPVLDAAFDSSTRIVRERTQAFRKGASKLLERDEDFFMRSLRDELDLQAACLARDLIRHTEREPGGHAGDATDLAMRMQSQRRFLYTLLCICEAWRGAVTALDYLMESLCDQFQMPDALTEDVRFERKPWMDAKSPGEAGKTENPCGRDETPSQFELQARRALRRSLFLNPLLKQYLSDWLRNLTPAAKTKQGATSKAAETDCESDHSEATAAPCLFTERELGESDRALAWSVIVQAKADAATWASASKEASKGTPKHIRLPNEKRMAHYLVPEYIEGLLDVVETVDVSEDVFDNKIRAMGRLRMQVLLPLRVWAHRTGRIRQSEPTALRGGETAHMCGAKRSKRRLSHKEKLAELQTLCK